MPIPAPADPESKKRQRRLVPGHSVVAKVSTHNRPQPLALLGDGFVHASRKLGFPLIPLRRQPLADRLPQHREPSIAVLLHAQSASKQEKNKAEARAFVEEVLSTGKLDRYSDFHTPDFVGHSTDHDFTLAEDLAMAREERAALPDMQFAVNHIVADGDLVMVHWTVRGTNTQPGMGLPATGKPIKTSGMTLFHFKAGKISEEWSAWSMLSVLKQVGLLCPPHS
jgi:steroid delta-isomerase-like uncharacterized protein